MVLDVGFYVDLLVSIGAGGLVGLERENRRGDQRVLAGVRTFPLISVTGFLLAFFTRTLGEPGLLAVGVLVMGALAAVFMVVRHRVGVTGFTTPMAMIVTFLVGVLAGSGLRIEAAVVAVATTLLLLTKQRLHRFAEVLDEEEIMSALQFVTVAFILLPLAASLEEPLPGTRGLVGPGELFDPYHVLLLVLFVSLLSFGGFLAMRLVGPHRGVEVSGLLGGLVSSEATAASLAHLAEGNRGLVTTAVVGTLLATTMMLARNLAIAGFAEPTLGVARFMLPTLVLMVIAGALLTWRRRSRDHPEVEGAVEVDTPFAVGPAVKFAALFAILWAAAQIAQQHLGNVGVYATALGGFVSAGAAVASVASLHANGAVSLPVAGITAILATIFGAMNKLVVLRATNTEVYERARVPFVLLTAVGLVGLGATLLLL